MVLIVSLRHPLLGSFLFSFLTISCLAHYDRAYMRDAEDGFRNRANWMSGIRDDVKLSELALPGTHDSATFKYRGFLEDMIQTQVLNFKEQLKYGIRVFDIRIRHIMNKFKLQRGKLYLKLKFDDYLTTVNRFLEHHPSETVLFRLKEDHNPEYNDRGLGATLNFYLDKYKSKWLNTSDKNIDLGSARGKFIVLSDNEEFVSFGMNYKSFNITDRFKLNTNWDLYYKWVDVKKHLEKAIQGDPNQMYVNYLSARGRSYPYFVASGHSYKGTSAPRLSTGLISPFLNSRYPDFPRVDCFLGMCTIAFEGTNVLTKDKIVSYNNNINNQRRTVGVIMADFPGDLLIQVITENNKSLQK